MKILYLILFILLNTNSVFAQPNPLSLKDCDKHIPIATLEDKSKNLNIVKICRNGYLSVYDEKAKIPLYISYLSIPNNSIGCLKRSNNFQEDFSIPIEYRSTLKDYSNSGYDRGHMVPNDDLDWNIVTQEESFILTNITPQYSGFNRGVWKSLEEYTRNIVFSGKSLQIISGSVYSYNNEYIGNKVIVPNGFFKILIDVNSKEYLAFYFDLNSYTIASFLDYQVSIKEIENKINISINTMLDKNKKYSLWKYNKGDLRKEKSISCKRN